MCGSPHGRRLQWDGCRRARRRRLVKRSLGVTLPRWSSESESARLTQFHRPISCCAAPERCQPMMGAAVGLGLRTARRPIPKLLNEAHRESPNLVRKYGSGSSNGDRWPGWLRYRPEALLPLANTNPRVPRVEWRSPRQGGSTSTQLEHPLGFGTLRRSEPHEHR
jgi:hypothetical protein